MQWSLRKLTVPVSSSDLVLDVGSGGTPYPRADVLLDRLSGAEHRNGYLMQLDRPAVLADANKMPFTNQSFDFTIASHILEHMPEPEMFISELMRVSCRGYIETPNVIFERLRPYNIHCLEVALVDGVLHILRKSAPVHDHFLHAIGAFEKDKNWSGLLRNELKSFHVRYFWNEAIKFKIYHNDVDTSWINNIYSEDVDSEETADSAVIEPVARPFHKRMILSLANQYQKLPRRRRLRNKSLEARLRCPTCNIPVVIAPETIWCGSCNFEHEIGEVYDFEKYYV